jgi:hypothetical protein
MAATLTRNATGVSPDQLRLMFGYQEDAVELQEARHLLECLSQLE